MQRISVNVPGAVTSVLAAGQGRTTVLVHGTSSNAEMGWGPFYERLAAKRRCLAPDFVGSGQTEDLGQAISLDLLVSQVCATADHAAQDSGNDELDIVGYSLGAVVAAAAAAKLGRRVRRLVLLGGWVQSDTYMKLQFDLWVGLSQTDKRQLARLLLVNGVSGAFLQAAPPEVVQVALDRFTALLAPGGDRQAALDATIDIGALLPQITANTLVIGMQHDRLVPPAHCRALAQGIAGARYEEVNCGHLFAMEQPEAVLRLFEEHLDA